MTAARSAVSGALLSFALALLPIGCGDPLGPPGDVPNAWTAVAAGDYHTCGLATGGAAYCWGSNQFGQLGSDGVSLTPWPRRVEGDQVFVRLTSGLAHTCGLTAEGESYCWGRGNEGQLGNGDRANASRPVRTSGDWRLKAISAGHSHTCGVTLEGAGVCWGDNAHGQLGTGSTDPSREPVRVSDGGVRFFSISAGHTHTCGAGVSGLAYCWGDNRRAQLGTGSFTTTLLPTSVRTQRTFPLIEVGFETSCGITANGAPYCWGSNTEGQLARGPDVEVSGNPRPLVSSVPFNSISAGGGSHICGVSWTGTVYCWGEGRAGQLGDGESRTSRALVAAVGEARFVAVSIGLRHSCALTEDGAIFCWGDGRSGQLGNGDQQGRAIPVAVARGG